MAPVDPAITLAMWYSGNDLILALTSGTSALTVVYTITCLICYCTGKLHPLSLAYIDFGATFLWVYTTATTIFWMGGGDYGIGSYFCQMRFTFLFVATTGMAVAAVYGERKSERRRAKKAAAAAGGGGGWVSDDVIVPGMVEAPV
ncbi:uncharacterized protein H6S33_002868 [Morchella sextelata]|uniref:uncharacterized protein n=1 Tax=Morchella sextelata TaxID=1174677 RepID=UPI001D03BB53|nr:uncharacterized protein H6S33_002868 [Morchella sextelata]KAH0607834.1 hypothetical protein H6S33_002868 [Morchella sextelata]